MKRNVIVLISVSTILTILSALAIISGCGTGVTGNGPSPTPFIADIYVSTTGSDEGGDGSLSNPYRTIQKGMNEATTGESVGVLAGIYTEEVTWNATYEGITLKGVSRDNVILHGSSRCIRILSTPFPQDITIESMTVSGGSTSGNGAGINLGEANVVLYLKNIIVSQNSCEASGIGGGLYINDASSSLVAENCTFKNNTTGTGGGSGIYSYGSINLRNCIISNNNTINVGAGIYAYTGGKLENCLIYRNEASGSFGGGIFHFGENDTTLEVINCDIVTNEALLEGGGIRSVSGNTRIVNCIIWGNITSNPANKQISKGVSANVYAAYSDIQDSYAGTNIVDYDPNFESFPDEPLDLHLTANTTTEITQGGTTEGAPLTDFDGNPRPGADGKVSMGAYEF